MKAIYIFIIFFIQFQSIEVDAFSNLNKLNVNSQKNAFQEPEQFLVKGFRPPAVPLITFDPYMSIWSMASNLTDDWPRYWPGTIKGFAGLIRIDGVTFRYMGLPTQSNGNLWPPMQQNSVQVFPTRSVYSFQQNGVELNVTFTTPLLTDDYDLLSRPITYISFDVSSYDQTAHDVQLYYDNTGEISVDTVDEEIVWYRSTSNLCDIMHIGTSTQDIFGKTGDGVGIDWGYGYICVPSGDPTASSVMYGSLDARTSFATNGTLPTNDDTNMPRAASDNWPVLAVSWDLGLIFTEFSSKLIVFGYDDVSSISYFGETLDGYWKQNFATMNDLLDISVNEFSTIVSKCVSLDYEVLSVGYEYGGSNYATMLALAYRQVLAGCKLVWNDNLQTIWYFMKEISSDGDISTVDVIFPASPFFVVYSPDLLTKLMMPLLAYANNETSNSYDYVYAPHHLGTWPVADILSSQQENMPIEETGNILMMIASIVQSTDDISFIYPHYWHIIEAWGNYLIQNLPDPGNQLCTDDFEGPIPHDANLAVKGIIGLDCVSYLYSFLGNQSGATIYHKIALKYALDWTELANPNNTDHYALRYDKPGWSLKYNLLYQVILGLNTFTSDVFDMELTFYGTKENSFGVPLDNRHDYTKLDWEFWVASLFADDVDWLNWVDFLYNYADQTPTRVPLSDWYNTTDASQIGFQARTVVGGLFAKIATQTQTKTKL